MIYRNFDLVRATDSGETLLPTGKTAQRVVYGRETIDGGMDEHSETGSLSNQSSTPCNRTTSPTTMSAGATISAAATRRTIVSNVPATVR